MDRIEDESIRMLFFLTAEQGHRPGGPRDDDDDEMEFGVTEVDPDPDPPEQDRKAAQAALTDFTRTVQRQKEREMEQLQFLGGQAGPSDQQTVVKGDKVGRNDLCPCGSGKKFKKCHGR
jgi:preprotein translocase subunit SecA